jgi:hypothetical protein
MSLTLFYIVIAWSVSDVPAHRSALLWHEGLPAGGWLWQAGVAISERDSFASLGMTDGKLFVGQYTSQALSAIAKGKDYQVKCELEL